MENNVLDLHNIVLNKEKHVMGGNGMSGNGISGNGYTLLEDIEFSDDYLKKILFDLNN